jgi:hypothetical protein
MKQRGYAASTHQRCEYCPDTLFSRQFYLFPCGHGYHCDCALEHAGTILGHDPAALLDARKTAMLIDSMNAKSRGVLGMRDSGSKTIAAKLEQLQNELDGYIAAECVFCGSVMIRLVATPLISPDEADQELAWSLK